MIDTTYDAIVFDNDGVLIEPTDRDRLVDAVLESFAALGASPDEAFVRETIGAHPIPFESIREAHGIDPEEWWPRREAAATAVQQAAIRSGQKALYDDVDALGDLAHPLGLASNNQHETIEFILDHHGLGHHFETFYGRDPTVEGARRKKPNPHYLERVLDDLGTRSAVYVGDSEKDVRAAERAGVDSAFLRREHRADLSLAVEPTYEFPDLRSFVDAVPASPKA